MESKNSDKNILKFMVIMRIYYSHTILEKNTTNRFRRTYVLTILYGSLKCLSTKKPRRVSDSRTFTLIVERH